MPGRRRTPGLLVAVWLLVLAAPVAAEGPRVAIIIDDMGNHRQAGMRALALPGPVTYAFLPRAPATPALARRAHQQGKEVMLHQPMQAVAGQNPGPGAITLHMTRQDVQDQLLANLDSVPHAVGVNNHMGSLITRHPGHMTWLMRVLKRQGPAYFIDSRTTRHTVAARMAREVGVPVAPRDVFLDNQRSEAPITRQFDRLIATARREGAAIGIAHAHPQTIRVLAGLLPRLAGSGIRLVPVSRLVPGMQREETRQWHASSSPSPKASKSSRPSPSSTCSAGPRSTCMSSDSTPVR